MNTNLIYLLRKNYKKRNTPQEEAADALEQQAAVIEQMREALKAMIVCARDEGKGLRIADEALTLQPCPEVLNKVRADAVREVINSIKGHAHSEVTRKALDFADLIEKGKA